jgi:hypothetical protein
MSDCKVFCFSCKKDVPFITMVGRRDECPFCRADLHVCKNCIHYDEKSYNECREPQGERVVEKEKSNFCDFFSPAATGQDLNKSRDSIMSAAEALFKKS